MQRRLWLPLGALFVVAFVGTLVPGCFGRECDSSAYTFGLQPGEGRMLDTNTWESNPIDGTWLSLPHQGRIVAAYTDATKGPPSPPDWVQVYISPSARPTDIPYNNNTLPSFTLAGGNVAKLYYRPGVVEVYNDTCSDFSARILIHGPSTAFAVNVSDGGGDGGPIREGDADAASDAGDAGEGGH